MTNEGTVPGRACPAVIVRLIFQRYLVRGVTLGMGKQRTTTRGMHL